MKKHTHRVLLDQALLVKGWLIGMLGIVLMGAVLISCEDDGPKPPPVPKPSACATFCYEGQQYLACQFTVNRNSAGMAATGKTCGNE